MNDDLMRKWVRFVTTQGLLNGSLTKLTPRDVQDYLEFLLLQQLILNKISGYDEYSSKRQLINEYMKRYEGYDK